MKKCVLLIIKGFDPELAQGICNELQNWKRILNNAVSGALCNRVPIGWQIGVSQALCGMQVSEIALGRHLTDFYPGIGLTVAAYGLPTEKSENPNTCLEKMLDDDRSILREATKHMAKNMSDLTVIALSNAEELLRHDKGDEYLSEIDCLIGELLDVIDDNTVLFILSPYKMSLLFKSSQYTEI